MMKKTIFVMFCLAPFAANAEIYYPDNQYGSTFDTSGLTVSDMSIGYAYSDPVDGNYYAGTDISQANFSIRSDGPIVVDGTLSIAEGYVLGLGANAIPATPIDMTFNVIDANGTLTIEDADTLTISGSVTADAGLAAQANVMTSGAINLNGGNATLTVAEGLTVAQFTNDGTGNVSISAGSITSNGAIQNGEAGGSFTMLSGGDITSSGSIENSGASMEIGRIAKDDVVNISLTGGATMKNDSNDSTMTINADSLSIAGGDGQNPSFVNKGNLYATITGETNLAFGFDLSAMQSSNTFHLDTGTLVFGPGADNDLWLQISANNLNEFYLAVREGTLTLTDIVNGQGNANANMDLIANSITADSVTNNASAADTGLSISTVEGSAGEINISGVVNSVAGSITSIDADGNLIIGGNVSNNGDMSLSGATVQLAAVSNNGGSLDIVSPTSETGAITISGNLTNNSGTALINARDISISGIVTNGSGEMTIKGSDTSGSDLSLGALAVDGGTVNLNALVGGVTVANALSVSNGMLNIDKSTTSLTVGQTIDIAGNISLSNISAVANGDVNIAASGAQGFNLISSNGSINIAGGINATDSLVARSMTLSAANISVEQDVNVAGLGNVVFGTQNSQNLNVTGDVISNNGGKIKFVTGSTTVGSLTNVGTTNGQIVASGSQIVATNGSIDIDGGVWFNSTTPTTGLVINGTNSLTLQTNQSEIDLAGGISVAEGNTLTVNAATAASLLGQVVNAGVLDIDANTVAEFDNKITNSGTLTVNAQVINGADITNTSSASLIASGNVTLGDIVNSDDLVVKGAAISTGTIDVTGGVMDVTGNSLASDFMTVASGVANINANTISVENNVSVTGDLVQGAETGALNLTSNDFALTSGGALSVSGAFNANAGSARYVFDDAATFGGPITVANGASVNFNAASISAKDLSNSGTLSLVADDGISLGVITNTGDLTLDSGAGISEVTTFIMGNTGTVELGGAGLTSEGAFSVDGMLYQNYASSLNAGDVNVISDNYVITASNFNAASGINQISGEMTVNSSDIDVGGSIQAVDLKLYANPSTNWMDVNVAGSVSGGVGFFGIEQMTIGENYIFDNGSSLNAAILPYAAGPAMNSTTRNYWASVSLNEDDTLGIITNPEDAQAMITVGGEFVSNVSGFGVHSDNSPLQDGQIGINLFDIVNQGTAIWLVHADDGIRELGDKIRNLNVNFCNADGSICFNYLDSLDTNNGASEDLPAYLSMRDTDGDGQADSIYIVFDPRFGGPVEVFKIQPIVGRTEPHTEGEYVSAGALDNLIEGQLLNTGFFNNNPIEVIPVMFKGTNLETMAQELYNRMEYYYMNRDGAFLSRFSRLFQARELEQIAGSIALNEHTNFRSFEDRMFDEFIWNRNRSLKKAWLDVDFGMFNQKVSDGKRVDGNRFNVSGGFDWQHSETMILGLTGRISNMSSENFDSMDLGYMPGESILGQVKTNVADTNLGLGGYMMKTLGEKTRVYGNAFLDIHFLDVLREQNFVAPIDGSGTAFSLISEWGLLHDWLNEYIVGNMYARVGYNFGFSVKEKAANQDYMNLKSDGYLILTPGYSLIAQKRIYPSAWFQIRPYASIGVEYDVLGAPDFTKYKFALAHSYTKYDVDIDPLWANIGGGVELLSASGIQVGLDYRYQYNPAIQLHNIKVSGSYRF